MTLSKPVEDFVKEKVTQSHVLDTLWDTLEANQLVAGFVLAALGL